MNLALTSSIRTRRTLYGFTLIELMLAIVIFAVVLTAINGVFFGAMRLRNKTTAMLERSVPVAQAMTIIRRDLMGIVAPNGLLSGSLKTGAATGGLGQETSLEFFSNTAALDELAPWGEIQRISYALRDPTNRLSRGLGKDLVRLVTRNLLPTAQEVVEEEGLMNDVTALEFGFYDGTQWRTSWDSTTETTVLPKAIRLILSTAPEEEEGVPGALSQRTGPTIQLVVPVVVNVSTNQVSDN
jgi:general secretion pathway protein J